MIHPILFGNWISFDFLFRPNGINKYGPQLITKQPRKKTTNTITTNQQEMIPFTKWTNIKHLNSNKTYIFLLLKLKHTTFLNQNTCQVGGCWQPAFGLAIICFCLYRFRCNHRQTIPLDSFDFFQMTFF